MKIPSGPPPVNLRYACVPVAASARKRKNRSFDHQRASGHHPRSPEKRTVPFSAAQPLLQKPQLVIERLRQAFAELREMLAHVPGLLHPRLVVDPQQLFNIFR